MTAPCPFVPGQRVVCVNDAPNLGAKWVGKDQPPVRGEIYTIWWVGPNKFGRIVVHLAEIRRDPVACNNDPSAGYDWHRFRPLDEQTDGKQVREFANLDLFRRMCAAAPVGPIVPGCETPLEKELI